MGTFYGLTFNYLCMMSLISHWRAAWADPGVIKKGMVRLKYSFKMQFDF
jgi:hypothetical protein